MAKKRRSARGNLSTRISALVLIIGVLYVFYNTGVLNRLFGAGDTSSSDTSSLVAASGAVSDNADVAVHFIDVGQGDSIYIKAYDKNILIDAGEKETTQVDIVEYLKAQHVTKLNYVICTHPHTDHIGGMLAVIDNFEIGTIIMPKIPDSLIPTTKTYSDLLTEISQKGLKITPSQTLNTSTITVSEGKDATLQFLGPLGDYEELNSMSVCVKFSAKGYSALLCGDAQKDAEQAMIDAGENLKCNILKLTHHGSSTGNAKSFLDAASPDCFVISVGKDNPYGHPSDSVIKRVEAYQKPVYRTDENGTVVFEFLDHTIKCIAQKGSE